MWLSLYERALSGNELLSQNLETSIITGSFCLEKHSCENLFNVEHFCDKIFEYLGQNSKNN